MSDLVELVASALYQVKAYDLPSVCQGLGLAPGDGEESFRSKRQYARVRLQGLAAEELHTLARSVSKQFPTYELDEYLAISDEAEIRKISEIMRRNLGRAVKDEDLSPRKSLVETLKATWPIDVMSSGWELNMEAAIDRHMIRNDDWSNEHLLEELGAYTCSQKRFFSFLESIVHPLARDEADQRRLVEQLNPIIGRDGFALTVVGDISGYPVYKVAEINARVRGSVKNLIFAANGPKPDIVLSDAISNDIQIVKNAEFCLVYDIPFPASGLRWSDMVEWWEGIGPKLADGETYGRSLYNRLKASLASPPEKFLFQTYFKTFLPKLKDRLPALVPQVYLHYDPYTIKMLKGIKRLPRQRMDFLLLFSNSERIVVEIDGKQHYANNDEASPALYAEMVAADRDLRLAGYEVYRFGGFEFRENGGQAEIEKFFASLFQKHQIF